MFVLHLLLMHLKIFDHIFHSIWKYFAHQRNINHWELTHSCNKKDIQTINIGMVLNDENNHLI